MRTLALATPILMLSACGNNTGLNASVSSAAAASGTTSGASTSTGTASTATTSTATTSTATTSATSTGTASGSATSSASSSPNSGASTTSSSTSGGIPDPDPSILPVISNPNHNPVLSPIEVVTVTFTGYPYTSQVQALGDYLAHSNYIAESVGEYGVGALTNTNVDTGQAAPMTATDTSIQSWISANVVPAGRLPAPASGATPLYVLYYPASTQVTNQAGGQSCVSFSGYHLENFNQLLSSVGAYYYAVISDCGTGLGDVESIALHEIAEAASDPQVINVFQNGWADRDTASPYVQSNLITEIADLCEGQYLEVDAGTALFTLQQLWSEAAALDGGAPCVPVDPLRPYYTVLPDSLKVTAAAGSSAVFHLTGWSSAPLRAWALTTSGWSPALNAFTPGTPQLGATTLSNGQTTTLTVPIPSGTASGAAAGVYIYSAIGDGTYAVVPVMAYAQ